MLILSGIFGSYSMTRHIDIMCNLSYVASDIRYSLKIVELLYNVENNTCDLYDISLKL